MPSDREEGITPTVPAADPTLTRRSAELLDLEELFLAGKEQLAHRVVRYFFREATAAGEAHTVTGAILRAG